MKVKELLTLNKDQLTLWIRNHSDYSISPQPQEVEVTETKCDECANQVFDNTEIRIYRGWFCRRGMWNECGVHKEERSKPTNIWNNCTQFKNLK